MKEKIVVAFLLIILAVAVPALCSFAILLPGLADVMRSGMCPPAPPDIPAYACTPFEYLARMTIGPWALVGNLAIAVGWWFVMALGIGGFWLARRGR